MKQILIILCFAIGFSSLNAQVVKSSSRKIVVQHVNASKDNIWYFKEGLNFMSLIDDYSNGTKVGYKFDWGFKKTIKELKTDDFFNPYWGMDFSISSMGGKTKGIYYDKYEIETERFANCFQWSFLNLGFDFIFSDKVKLDVHAGGFLSLALLNKERIKGRYIYHFYDYADYNSWDWDDDDFYWFDLDRSRDFIDLGINLGVGLWINSFNFEVGYQRSTGDPGIKGSNIIFKFGSCYSLKHNSANR